MASARDMKKLDEIPALRELGDGALRTIALSTETRVVRTGDVLFRRDEFSTCGFAILDGSVVLESAPGHPRATVRAPALIGEAALIVETQWPVRALVAEPSVVLRIPRTLFHQVLADHPIAADALRRRAEQTLRAVQAELNHFARTTLAA